jgi:hypothetical protein
MQRKPLDPVEKRPFGQWMSVDDPNVEAYFLKDVNAAGNGPWRWTGKRPELKFYLEAAEGLKFAMSYGIAEATFKVTGPVELSIFVNDKLLDKVRHSNHGKQEVERPVPPAMLHRNAVNVVAIEIDKVWTSPEDGAKLGFLLAQAGFVK